MAVPVPAAAPAWSIDGAKRAQPVCGKDGVDGSSPVAHVFELPASRMAAWPPYARLLARGVVEGDDGVELVPAELEGGPVVAAVAACPELAIGETSEQAAIGSEECVRHCS